MQPPAAESEMPDLQRAALAKKNTLLQSELRRLRRVLVAYSGGVDSAYLAYTAHQALGENMLAVIADSPSLARTQLEDALRFTEEQRIPCQVMQTQELENANYIRNDAQRCFHCKDELFMVMERYR